MRYLKKLCTFIIWAGLTALPAMGLAANGMGADTNAADKHEPSTFVADTVSYDNQHDLVIASGKVEIANSQHVLLADEVVYDKKTDQMAAKGHVVLYQATGEVIFADKMQLTSDLHDGFMTAVGLVMPDNSRFVANSGERFSGRFLRLYNGIYTPYPTSDSGDQVALMLKPIWWLLGHAWDEPATAPLWQMEGGQIIHDEGTHDIIYHDAWLDIYGQPLLYSPYFSTPDPTVKARSGFLTPTVAFGGSLGDNMRIPYYYQFEPETDLTVTPWLSVEDGLQMDALMRHRFTNGYINVEASGLDGNAPNPNGIGVQDDVFRGHFRSDGLLDLDDGWRIGEDTLLETDDTYLVRYKYSGAAFLTNRLYAENFDGRNYFLANGYYFQNELPGTPEQPVAAPDMEYSAFGKPGELLDGRWSFNSGLLDLLHDSTTNTDVQRGSVAGGWERKVYSDSGVVGTFNADVRDDIYFTHNLPLDGNLSDTTDPTTDQLTANRFFPSTNAQASYPVARRFDSVQQTIEPIVALYAAPIVNQNNIPNIDSQDYELDATNIFDPNRFSGIDRLEGGTRATYGVKTGLYGDGGGSSSLFLGESYNFQSDPYFPEDSGLSGHRSDVVGQLEIYPSNLLTFDYNFRLDSNTLAPNLHEADIIAGDKNLRVALDYLYIQDQQAAAEIGNANGLRQQFTYGINGAISDYWTAAATQTIDLTGEGILTSSFRLIYADEGISFSITANFDNTERSGLTNGTEVLMEVSFKGLGGQVLQPLNGGTFGASRTTSIDPDAPSIH